MLPSKIFKLAIFFIALCSHAHILADNGSEKNRIDSLIAILNNRRTDIPDTTRFSLILDITQAYLNTNVDSSQYYSQMLYDEAGKSGDEKYKMYACERLEDCYFYQCEYDKCSDLCFEGLAIALALEDTRMMARFYSSLGSSYGMRANATMADEYYNKAYQIYSQIADTTSMISVMNNMAINALNNDMFDTAEEYAKMTLEICRDKIDARNRIDFAESYFILGGSLGSRYDFDPSPANVNLLTSSVDNYYISRNMSLSGNDFFDVAKCNIYIIQNYTEMSELMPKRRTELLDSCKILLDEAYSICVNNGFDSLLDMYKNSRLAWLIKTYRYGEAESYLDSLSSVYSADIENHGMEIEDTYGWYAELYSKMGKYDKAYDSHTRFHRWYRWNRHNDFAAKSASNMAETRFKVEMQARERETYQRELQYRANTKIMFIIIFAIIIILILVIINFIKSRKSNQMLDEKNCELEQQKEEILVINEDLEHQRDLLSNANLQITDSISYARLIQNAAMPSNSYLNEVFGENFVYFRPKDIVSGDFYWAHQGANKQLLVVADCTGHGVPGAFVSMLGISMLNEIVARFSMGNEVQQMLDAKNVVPASAGRFLDDLRSMLRDSLHQHGEEANNRDGMDLALIIIDNDTQTIHFAGAFRPLYIYHNGTLTKVAADRMPIGGDLSADAPFTDHELPLCHGDMLYLFTDGIVDQFGFDSQRNKEVKFSARRLQALLSEINALPCSEQLKRIQSAIDDWRNVGTWRESEQTDDNLMVGIRL